MKLKTYLICITPIIIGYITILTREKSVLYSTLILTTFCGMFTMGYKIKEIDQKEEEEEK